MKPRDVVRAALRDEWDGLERINKDLRLADFFTILNALTGIAAIAFIANGQLFLGAHAILFGVLLDGVDGAVARLGKGGGPLGPPLDSLADAVTFVVAPAMLALASAGLVDAPWWMFASVAVFASAGLLRLARFESLRTPMATRYFSGLPSPAGGVILASASLYAGMPSSVMAVLLAGSGFLMVSRIRYPKLKGALGAVVVLSILAVLGTYQVAAIHDWAVRAILVLMAIFLVFGPFYVLLKHGPTRVEVPA